MSNRNTRIITQALERGLYPDDEPMSPIAKPEQSKEPTLIVSKVLSEASPTSEERKDIDKQIADLALPGNPVRNLDHDFFSNATSVVEEEEFPLNKTLFKHLSEVEPPSKTKSRVQRDDSSDSSVRPKSAYESSDSSLDLPIKTSSKEIVSPSEKYISSRVKLVPYPNNVFSSGPDVGISRRVKTVPFVSSNKE